MERMMARMVVLGCVKLLCGCFYVHSVVINSGLIRVPGSQYFECRGADYGLFAKRSQVICGLNFSLYYCFSCIVAECALSFGTAGPIG